MANRGRGIHSSNQHNTRRRRLMLNKQHDIGVSIPLSDLDEQSQLSDIISFKYPTQTMPDTAFFSDVQDNIRTVKQDHFSQQITKPTVKSSIELQTHGHLLSDLRELIAGTKPIRWFFAGDDVVGGATKAGEEPGFVDLFAERIRWELRRFPDVIINAGHPELAIHKLGEKFEKKLLDFKPDVLMLMPGRRESLSGRMQLNLYRENLRKLVKLLRSKGVTVVLQTPPPFLRSDQSHHVLEVDQNYLLGYYVETIREIASEHEFPLIDHFADWEHLPDSKADLFIDPESQRVSGNGQRRICSLLFHELDLYDTQSPICKLCYSAG